MKRSPPDALRRARRQADVITCVTSLAIGVAVALALEALVGVIP